MEFLKLVKVNGEYGFVRKQAYNFAKEKMDIDKKTLSFHPMNHAKMKSTISIGDIESDKIPQILKICNPKLWKRVTFQFSKYLGYAIIFLYSKKTRKRISRILLSDECINKCKMPMEFKDGVYYIPIQDFFKTADKIKYYDIKKEEYEGVVTMELI